MQTLTMYDAGMVSGAGFWADVGAGLEIAGGVALVGLGVASAIATDGLDAPAAAAAVRGGAAMIAGGVSSIGGGVATLAG